MSNKYTEFGGTAKYQLVMLNDSIYRIENRKGVFCKEVQHIDMTRDVFESYEDVIVNWRDYGDTKSQMTKYFNTLMDEMFDYEHSVLYPESVK